MSGMKNDHANPRATIAFVIYYPFQFYVYKNVYQELKDEAEFIIDLGPFLPNKQPDDVRTQIEALLKKNNASYRILHHEDYFYPRYIERFLNQYSVLVSVWQRGCMTREVAYAKKRVHMTYGAGKELTTFDLNKVRFDLILAYGEYDHAFYTTLTHSVIIGNPKFDDWFRKKVNYLPDVEKRLKSERKTILYLPTHSDLSSIRELAAPLTALTDAYNVIVKLHYYTPREEPHLLALLTHPSLIVVYDDTDILPLLHAADVVVSDNSSAIFDAMLAGKPVIATDFLDAAYLEGEHKNIRTYRRGLVSALTYTDSIEQRVKRDGTVYRIKKPDELALRIESVLDNDSAREKRDALAMQLFSFREGTAGERAAQAIRALVTGEVLQKRFMYHALNHYTTQTLRRPFLFENKMTETKTHSETFTIFWIDEGTEEPEAPRLSIRALGELDYPDGMHEMVLVSPRAIDGTDIFPKNPNITIRQVQLQQGETLGSALSREVERSKGTVIAFTTSACITPVDWLKKLQSAYGRYPAIAGAGGYVITQKEHYSYADEIQYYRLGKLLGVEREPRFLFSLYEVTSRLLYQNPAGNLQNMSYKKDGVAIDSRIRTMQELQLHLKVAALTIGPLCFLPLPVTRVTARSLKRCIKDAFEEGVLNRIARNAIQSTGSFRTYSLFLVVYESFALTRMYRDVRYGATAFLLGMARWGGEVSGRFLIFSQKAEREFRETFLQNR